MRLQTCLTGIVVAALVSTATWAQTSDGGTSKSDPFEGWNRVVFTFNEAVDAAVLKPVALAYQSVVPSLVRAGVDNFFSNLGNVWTVVNLVLQAKPQPAVETGFRFLTNTFFGLGGLLDVAGELNIERRNEDLGQTLGWWGVPAGPYLVLPLLGPSTLRDVAARTIDSKASLTRQVWSEPADRNGAAVLQVINLRSNLLGAGKLLDDIALDKYSLFRDGFLARRRNQVYDGDPPDE